ncbi:hypothetical protein AVEN_232766-1 [Araneus ventricosus]|uniref:Uncharacterized protein n=1 Tax=Araneus ventricosus TaxID=182803 RepID=A0A4Y2JIA2_ARAVE|nr:hypothetical protein AVEN_54238-1 [Araneus ventricosus]GBM81723.1 hypothetical protein AVEN_139470-1 [Araneus ventricosus]GBM89159.1 hypothetical protein AVEN_232766-1 [Araneus ventricosus]
MYTKKKYFNRRNIPSRDFDESPRFGPLPVRTTNACGIKCVCEHKITQKRNEMEGRSLIRPLCQIVDVHHILGEIRKRKVCLLSIRVRMNAVTQRGNVLEGEI